MREMFENLNKSKMIFSLVEHAIMRLRNIYGLFIINYIGLSKIYFTTLCAHTQKLIKYNYEQLESNYDHMMNIISCHINVIHLSTKKMNFSQVVKNSYEYYVNSRCNIHITNGSEQMVTLYSKAIYKIY